MAKKWYPVVDILTCIECGTCVKGCPHSVYDKSKAPSPLVISPEKCKDHCHKCGENCSVGAITYVGEDTGWVPPALKNNSNKQQNDFNCGCECSCTTEPETVSDKVLRIEYLYLDLNTCDRCIGTDVVLDEVVKTLRPALKLAGYEVDYQKWEMATAQIAEQYHFLSSPTIRVNGYDIFGEIKESNCGCCGELAGTDIDCRIFEYEGRAYEVPTKEMLAKAILQSIDKEPLKNYEMPENLKRFYEGKKKISGQCCCDGGCG